MRLRHSLIWNALSGIIVVLAATVPLSATPSSALLDCAGLLQNLVKEPTRSDVIALYEALPQQAPLVSQVGIGRVPEMAFFRFSVTSPRTREVVTETVLVLSAGSFDPILRKWLEAARSQVASKDDPENIARHLYAFVRQTFRHGPGHWFWNPRGRKIYRELTTEDLVQDRVVRLGELIHHGVGVCRHQTIALQLALQASGVESRIVTGRLTTRFTKDSQMIDASNHAWVEVKISPTKYLLLDPSAGIERSIGTEFAFEDRKDPPAPEAVRSIVVRDRAWFSEEKTFEYTPARLQNANSGDNARALSKENFKSFLNSALVARAFERELRR